MDQNLHTIYLPKRYRNAISDNASTRRREQNMNWPNSTLAGPLSNAVTTMVVVSKTHSALVQWIKRLSTWFISKELSSANLKKLSHSWMRGHTNKLTVVFLTLCKLSYLCFHFFDFTSKVRKSLLYSVNHHLLQPFFFVTECEIDREICIVTGQNKNSGCWVKTGFTKIWM